MAGYHYLYKRLNTVWGVGGGTGWYEAIAWDPGNTTSVVWMIAGVRPWPQSMDWSEEWDVCDSRGCQMLWSHWEIARKDCEPGRDLSVTPVPVIWPISCWISQSLLLTCLSSLSRYSQLTELSMKCSIKHLSIHSPPSVDIRHDLKQFLLQN